MKITRPNGFERWTRKWLSFPALLLVVSISACSGGGGGDISAVEPGKESTPPVIVTQEDGLTGRFIVGYQGWFGCPGDFEGNSEWLHWFHGLPGANTLLVDMLPNIAELSPTDLCNTGLTGQDGQPIYVFSSQNPNIVDYHFKVLARNGVKTVALQRFVVEIENPQRKRRLDNVLKNVMAAAERNGVSFFISYDVTNANPNTVIKTIREDWRFLSGELNVVRHARYVVDSGKPVLQLWGFGVIDNHPGEPAEVASLLADLKSGRDGLVAVTTIGGVAAGWRTLEGDSKSDPAWSQVYLSFDILSPWTVGHYINEASTTLFFEQRLRADVVFANAHGVRYLPVIFPGFSWFNMMNVRGQPDKAIVNQIPRDCGNFLWRQATLLRAYGVKMAYGAMADEYDEGTALLPAQVSRDKFPSNIQGVYLDQDGCDLQADWYSILAGRIAGHFRNGTIPETLSIGR